MGTRQPCSSSPRHDDHPARGGVRARLGREHLDLGDVDPVDALLAAVGQHAGGHRTRRRAARRSPARTVATSLLVPRAPPSDHEDRRQHEQGRPPTRPPRRSVQPGPEAVGVAPELGAQRAAQLVGGVVVLAGRVAEAARRRPGPRPARPGPRPTSRAGGCAARARPPARPGRRGRRRWCAGWPACGPRSPRVRRAPGRPGGRRASGPCTAWNTAAQPDESSSRPPAKGSTNTSWSTWSRSRKCPGMPTPTSGTPEAPPDRHGEHGQADGDAHPPGHDLVEVGVARVVVVDRGCRRSRGRRRGSGTRPSRVGAAQPDGQVVEAAQLGGHVEVGLEAGGHQQRGLVERAAPPRGGPPARRSARPDARCPRPPR